VLGLTASPEAILRRVGEAHDRPLLSGGDRHAQLATLLVARESAYAQADWRVDTTELEPEAAADRLVAWLDEQGAIPSREGGGEAGDPPGLDAAGSPLEVEVPLTGGAYRILVGAGLLGRVGHHLGRLGLGGRAVVVTDQGVPAQHVEAVLGGLRASGIGAEVIRIPAGEAAKGLDQLARLYHSSHRQS